MIVEQQTAKHSLVIPFRSLEMPFADPTAPSSSPTTQIHKCVVSVSCSASSAKPMLLSHLPLSPGSGRGLLHTLAHEHVVYVTHLVFVNAFHMPPARCMNWFPSSIRFVSISYCSEYSHSLSCHLLLKIFNVNIFYS